MKALLDPLRQIARDLVEKRLWPVAVLLLAAFVALPVVIGSSSDSTPPPPPVAAAATPGTPDAKSLVTRIEPAAAGKHDAPGEVSDPFYDPPAPPADATGAVTSTTRAADRATPAAGTQAAAAPGSATSHVGAGATTPKQRSTRPVGAKRPSTRPVGAKRPSTRPVGAKRPSTRPVGTYYRTVVRWAAAGGEPRTIARLTPLGGRADPAALYLGATKAGATYAVFLLGSNATSHGDGACRRATACRIIGLRAGDSQVITVRRPGGTATRRFKLHVRSVGTVATGAARARTMRIRVHPDGRDVMRAMWQHAPTAAALGPLRYDPASGRLYAVRAATAGAKPPKGRP